MGFTEKLLLLLLNFGYKTLSLIKPNQIRFSVSSAHG